MHYHLSIYVRAGLYGTLLCLLGGTQLRAKVVLPSVFSDHMVLQRDQTTVLWGWADAGEKLTVHWGPSSVSLSADEKGKWSVRLESRPAGGPFKLRVEGEANSIHLTDIYVGEVWICSGQSNMEWSVQKSADSMREVVAADHPQIRMFTVRRHIADAPEKDVQGTWAVCGPETVARFSAVGYYFGRHLHQELSVPIGLLHTSWGGSVCEAWTSLDALQGAPEFESILGRRDQLKDQNQKDKNLAARLYNGMLAPLIPYTIRGAIWYQGESNVDRAAQYRKLFPTMILDWRARWRQGDFPFYYVQLAPYRYDDKDPRHCAELWEAQLRTLALPNTGMAVTMDIGDVKDIHPTNKQDVGRRLALWALANTYGVDVAYSGPLYKSMRIDGNQIRIAFDHAGGGLTASDGNAMREFTVAGDDRKFVPAAATIEGERIVVSSEHVPQPKAVRFAWRDDAQPNLANQNGLPASPFRTDDWPLVTAGNH